MILETKETDSKDGTNAKLTEVHAAVGLANLKYLDAALADRERKYFENVFTEG